MKIKLTLEYKGPRTTSIQLESDWIEEKYAENLMDDMLKTGRFTDVSITDEMGREWTRKEYGKLKQKMELEPANPQLYFDGGFDIQTGASGIGVVIYYEKGNEKFRYRANAKLDELETNNEAEYAALYNGLLFLKDIGIQHLPCVIRGDSQGVLKQLAGEWPCYEKALNVWLDRIEALIKELGIKPIIEVISRRDNKEADKLAGQALSDTVIHSHLKIE